MILLPLSKSQWVNIDHIVSVTENQGVVEIWVQDIGRIAAPMYPSAMEFFAAIQRLQDPIRPMSGSVPPGATTHPGGPGWPVTGSHPIDHG